MTPEIEALAKAAAEAHGVKGHLHTKRSNYVESAVEAARRKAEAEATTMFDVDIEKAHQHWVHARMALEQARIEHAESFADAPYPKGTRFAKWRLASYPRKWWPVRDVFGVLEIVNHDTIHPDNRNRLCEPGDYVIRVLKKDGTPSKIYERIHRGSYDGKWHTPWDWYPEGVDPNKDDK